MKNKHRGVAPVVALTALRRSADNLEVCVTKPVTACRFKSNMKQWEVMLSHYRALGGSRKNSRTHVAMMFSHTCTVGLLPAWETLPLILSYIKS